MANMMWLSILTVVCWADIAVALLSNESQPYDQHNEAYYRSREGFRHNITFSEAIIASEYRCVSECVRRRQCCAASVNPATNECRLSTYCLFSPDITEPAEGWRILTRHKAVCLVDSPDPSLPGPGVIYAEALALCQQYGGAIAQNTILIKAHQSGWRAPYAGWSQFSTIPVCLKLGDTVEYINKNTALPTVVFCLLRDGDSTQRGNMCWPI